MVAGLIFVCAAAFRTSTALRLHHTAVPYRVWAYVFGVCQSFILSFSPCFVFSNAPRRPDAAHTYVCMYVPTLLVLPAVEYRKTLPEPRFKNQCSVAYVYVLIQVPCIYRDIPRLP